MLIDWFRDHNVLIAWLGTISLIMFVGSLLAVPWLVIRVPADYFVRRRHFVDRWLPSHPLLRLAVLAIKNACGIVLVLVGAAMLFAPGQGVLTILIGIMLLDFPAKLALERRLVRILPVIGAINWMRAKAHRPPLQLPERDLK